MNQGVLRKLRTLSKLSVEIRHRAAEAEEHYCEMRKAAEQIQMILQSLMGIDGEVHAVEPYLVIADGKARPASEAEVSELRQGWRGEFLLDQPGRELRVRTGKKVRRLHLGHGGLHYGLEKVLLTGMGKPGRPFGPRSFEDALGYSTISGPESLSRYIWEIRKAIGDSARNSRYLHTVEVDRGLSSTGRGYEFDARWHYLVIRRT